jgi:hypothetical protein
MTEVYCWQQSYRDAVLELSPAEMRTKLARARSELEQRNMELICAQDENSREERQAIADALNGLRVIERSELTVPLETVTPRRPVVT